MTENTEKQGCGCSKEGCKCGKFAKWFPHNWIGGRVLRGMMLAMFYLVVIFTVVYVIRLIQLYVVMGLFGWEAVLNIFISLVVGLGISLVFLGFAKVIKALHKIKHALKN